MLHVIICGSGFDDALHNDSSTSAPVIRFRHDGIDILYPPPHVTEQCDISAISHWYSGLLHVVPSPPQTPHESIRLVDPIFKSHPTRYKNTKRNNTDVLLLLYDSLSRN